jgi:antibiotic biosynthesis monooxygenase (ABM) superfamily enzyme
MTPPPRWKLAIITWIAIYPIITALLLILGPFILRLPIPIVTLILSVTLVVLMTFVVMPALTRVFRPWLHAGQTGHRLDQS